MKSITYKDETMGADYIVGEIPADMLEEAKHYREQLIEKVSEVDDTILEKYLHGERQITEDEIKAALRKRVNSSVRTEGRRRRSCRSSAARRSRTRACSRCSTRSSTTCRRRSTCRRSRASIPTRRPETTHRSSARRRDDAPFAALGVQDHDRPVRRPAHVHPRLLGRADRRDRRSTTRPSRRTERIGRLLKMHANKREEIKEVYAGDIAAAVGLKSVSTGDTICDEKKPIVLESMDFPEPVISLAIEPKTKADQEKLGVGLAEADGRRSDLPREDRPADRPGRSSPAWASCTSRSSSTA